MTGLIPMKKRVIADQINIFTRDIRLDRFTHTGKVAPDNHCESTVVEGSHKIVPCAHANYFLSPANITGVTNQDNRQCGTEPAKPAQDVQTIDIALGQIQQEQIRRVLLDWTRSIASHTFPTISSCQELDSPIDQSVRTKSESRLTNSSLAVSIAFPMGAGS